MKLIKMKLIKMNLLLLTIFLQQAVWACSSCFAANTPEQTRSYILMTALLTLLPLSLIGSFIYWVFKNNKNNENNENNQKEDVNG